MELRTIRQTSHIDGINRNPGVDEHDKAMVWDNNSQKVKYVLINGLSANSKTVNGYVTKGDDSAAANYIWKLDASKNPSWRLEEYLNTITKVGNSAIFTMNSGATKTLALGALAWEDGFDGAVTSVFGRFGDVLAVSGDYTAAQVTNALDKLNDTLDDVLEGDTVKRFTATYKAQVDEMYLLKHPHSNKATLDLITDAGGGVIPSAAQISEWDTYSANDAENVMDTVSTLIQDNTGIEWIYDDVNDTLTPTIKLSDFTTDDLPEGIVNKYGGGASSKNVFTLILPTASTVAGRIAASVSGVNYPTGWTLTADGIDLLVHHNLNRKIANVTVFSKGELNSRQLFSNAAFSGIYQEFSDNYATLVIESLATIETEITIQLIFADTIENEMGGGGVPVVLSNINTNTPYGNTSISFNTGGNAVNSGNGIITEKGIVYSKTTVPTIELSGKSYGGSGLGSFACTVRFLEPDTGYYYRAYAINEAGVAYGNEIWTKTLIS